MWGQGRFSLYNCSLFSSLSIPLSSFILISMASLVTGKTHNVFLELSDTVFEVFYHSQHYSHHKTTLGSLKININSLAKPTVSILFPFLLLDLFFLTVFLIATLFRMT